MPWSTALLHHLGSGLQRFCIHFHPLLHIFIFIFKLPPALENILRKWSSRGQATLLPAWPELQCWLMNHCRHVFPGHHIWQRHCSYSSQLSLHGKSKPSALKKPKSTSCFPPMNRWIYPGFDFPQQQCPSAYTYTPILGSQGPQDAPSLSVLAGPRCLPLQTVEMCQWHRLPQGQEKMPWFWAAKWRAQAAAVTDLVTAVTNGGHCHIHSGLQVGGKRVTLWERWQTGLANYCGTHDK